MFGHSPNFDDINPLRIHTPSFLAMHGEKKEDVFRFSLKFTEARISQYIEAVKNRLKKGKYEDGIDEKEISIDLLKDYSLKVFRKKEKELLKSAHLFNYNPEKYESYLKNQLIELIETYQTDGMWMDWFMSKTNRENSTQIIMDLMQE